MWTGQMRSWLICLSWIMTLQHSLQDDPDVVIYDVLSLTMDNGLCPTTIDICLHTTEIILDSDTIALACEYKKGHETEQTFVSIEIPGPPTCCSSFIAESDAELELWQNFEAPVTCGIRVHHTDPAGSGFGSIVFDNPDAFPNCDGATSWSDDKRVGVYCSERNGFTDAVLTTVADIDGSFQSEGVIYTIFTTSVDDHSSVAAICIDIPNTSIDVLDGTTVKICSKQELVITPAPVKSTPGETELIYGSNIVITLSHDMTGNSVDCFVTPDDIATGSCVIDNTALTIPIAASYTGNNKNIVIFFNIYTNGATTNWGNIQLKDCKLTTLALTPHTIELSWESAELTDFTIEATAAGKTFTEKVTCIVDSPICYGYLIGLDENTEYTCSVFVTDGLNKISKSESTPAILTDLEPQQLLLKWGENVRSVAATLCFVRKETPVTPVEPSKYELLMINNIGQVLNTQGVRETVEGLLCFEKIELNIEEYDVSGKVVAVVVGRGADGHSIVASGESVIQIMVPRLERLTRKSGKVSWYNSDDHTFTIRREHHDAPLVTNLTCTTCSYYFTVGSVRSEEFLIIETEDSDVRITAEVPAILPAPGNI